MAQAANRLESALSAWRDAQSDLSTRDSAHARALQEVQAANTNLVVLKSRLDLAFKRALPWQDAEQQRKIAFDVAEKARAVLAGAAAAMKAAGDVTGSPEEKAWIEAQQASREANLALDQAEQALLRVQHDLTYQDAECAALRSEIKRAEADMIRARSVLTVREKLDDATREAARKLREAQSAYQQQSLEEQALAREADAPRMAESATGPVHQAQP